MYNRNIEVQNDVNRSQQRTSTFNPFQESEDNPLGESISKYYRAPEYQQARQKAMNRDTSFSNFERQKEKEARVRLSRTAVSEAGRSSR